MNALIPAWVNGEITPVDKMEVHLNGLRHKAISVFVIDGTKTLLQRRALGKYHTPGLWANTCCTHPMMQEAAVDCARRRLDEELGIRGLDLQFVDNVEYRANVGKDMIEHEVVDIFVARMAASQQFTINPSEVLETRWVEIDALSEQVRINPYQFTPWLRIYLTEHRNQIFKKMPASQVLA